MRSMTEFKRSLLEEIKARPLLWDRTVQIQATADETEAAWMDIQASLGKPAPIGKLKNTWRFFVRHYYGILMTKAIERNNEAPKWAYFHDMTFMYEQVTEKVRRNVGGISPPLLKPRPAEARPPCPCCLPPLYAPAQPTVVRNPTTESISPPRRRQQPLHVSGKGMRFIERERIIDAIKAHPILYDRDAKSNLPLWRAWRKVAEKVSMPLLTIQNRWRQFKRRYLEELMKERSSRVPFRSSWPNFKQMSFMRELMTGDIDKLDKVREEIEQLVNQKRTLFDPASDGDLRSGQDRIAMRDEDQGEVGLVTLEIPSEEDVIFLSDEEESAESYISEELPMSPEEDEVICIDDDDDVSE